MARQPRFDLPDIPQHVVQRGNNRLPCFLDDNDRRRYLNLLGEALLATGCALHAYVLMDNHVHLLLTPPEAGAISRLMQKLGRAYVGQFNARHRRTGTLWEGRYKSCLVDSASYVLRCCLYIDLNPPTQLWARQAKRAARPIDACFAKRYRTTTWRRSGPTSNNSAH
jgi:putative transposase